MDINKKPYEISLWEDILIFVVQNQSGNIIEYEEKIPSNAEGTVVAQYYKERKICIIGSDTMESPLRAVNGVLVSNINGTNILTFDMYSHYYDDDYGLLENPFIKLLINERKVKLRYGTIGTSDLKWYDLVIKGISENSDTKVFKYTAKDLFINELSKSGFDIQFDSLLENNIGNIETLATTVLDGSDWTVEEGDIFEQTVVEPLYQGVTNQSITVKNMRTGEEKIISIGSKIYIFYSGIVDKKKTLQLLYEEQYQKNDDNVIINSNNWEIENVNFISEKPEFVTSITLISELRGKKLVKKAKTVFDAKINKYVNVYNKNGKEYYSFTETVYDSPVAVHSIISNSSDFTNAVGWSKIKIGSERTTTDNPVISTVPDFRDVKESSNRAQYLKVKIENSDQALLNIIDTSFLEKGFTKNEEYIFRTTVGVKNEADAQEGDHGPRTLRGTGNDITLKVAQYTLTNGIYTLDSNNIYFNVTISGSTNDTNTAPRSKAITAKCLKSLSKKKLKEAKNLGIFISFSDKQTYYIKKIQFFNKIVKSSGSGYFLPEDVMSDSKINTTYYFYDPTQDYEQLEDIDFIYKGDSLPSGFLESYNDKAYEKIRSITASESNRFNLLQSLCEIFECWVKFEIEHDESGAIAIDENYLPKKRVSFHEFIGQENAAGFKYGINLNSIHRNIESENIVSKLIVKNNSNEFAKDGFCSIARALESESKENFILDFGYYVQQGLLGFEEITNDLYLSTNGYLGYYTKLKEINALKEEYIDTQSQLLITISQLQALQVTNETGLLEAENMLVDKKKSLKALTGFSYEKMMANQPNTEGANEKIAKYWDNETAVGYIHEISNLNVAISAYQEKLNVINTNLQTSQTEYDILKNKLTSKEEGTESERHLLYEKEQLNKAFYKKYSRFLQEGSWISEDYIDDNLYYLDALSTLYTASRPKITYEIKVIEISQVPDYENYNFKLGDKTYVEDVEFFGWVWQNGIKTPYKEEVIVSEISINLDLPKQNQIKVQNYKTHFEDLFQRMNAVTQSVEYSTGRYEKVSGIVNEDGTIDIVTLQNSVANNALILNNAIDQSVLIDSNGITTQSLSKPAELVRIVSGGIFLSNDGGATWNTGITGSGISANYLTTGMINTDVINIMNGAAPSFRWDAKGLSAYEIVKDEAGNVILYNQGKFVRMDQFGIYGINGIDNFDATVEDGNIVGIDKIKRDALFALTWDGFILKSSHEVGGYISITSSKDFQVFNKNEKEVVKIGYLERENADGEPVYGLQLSDNDGNIVLDQSSEGKVWIKNELSIGETDYSPATVKIGYLNNYKPDDSDVHEIINANDNFIVYEDGTVKAAEGEFTGTIHAISGTIGGLDIAAFTGDYYEVAITSTNGPFFRNGVGEKTLTANLYKGQQEVTTGTFTYQWFVDGESIKGATSKTLVVSGQTIKEKNSATYSCVINYTD